MKKLAFALALLISLTFTGCGIQQRTADDIYWAVPMTASKYKSYFEESPAEIVERINALADGHFDEIYQLHDDNERLWTQNGDYWVLSFTLDELKGRKEKLPYEVELDLSACGDTVTAGYMIEAFIGAFVPEEVDNITYWLDIYQENDSVDDAQELLRGNYGYLRFQYERGESLSITANSPLEAEESSFTPVKPK